MLLHDLVAELKDGFDGGVASVITFMRENVKLLLKASCEPSKSGIVLMFGTEPIVKFVDASFKEHQNAKP